MQKKNEAGYIKPSDKELTRNITRSNRPSVAQKQQEQPKTDKPSSSDNTPPSIYGAPPPSAADEPRSPVDYQRVMKGQSKFGTKTIAAVTNPEQAKEKVEEEGAEYVAGNQAADPFSPEQLIATWKGYAYQMKDAGKISFYNTLLAREPEIDGVNLTVKLDNAVQVSDFDRERADLMTYIRQTLNNYTIQLEHVLMDVDSNDAVKYYSPVDRFKSMADKNPALLELKNRLNLDIEH